MKKKILTAIMAMTMMVVLTGCGTKGAAKTNSDEKVLKIGMEGTYAPYTYHDQDGNLTGYEVDVANAIGKKMGYKVEFVEVKWDSMFEALDAKNFDAIMNQVTITDERLKKYDFSTPYIYSNPVLIVKTDNNEIKDFSDIKGKKAAEGLTSNFGEIAKKHGATIIGQDEFALAMELVKSKEADCTINDKLTYAYWSKTKKDTTSTKIVAESNDIAKSAVLTRKGNDALLKKINKAIAELKEDGTISKISQKYFDMDISNQ
ncbi:putative cystine-binding periplasmic protein [Lachnospiraceae bacterium KM106-2]|nr:putative cystine-binding periplasmic protein [Lachnospiraceae bacterium KM106-2]